MSEKYHVSLDGEGFLLAPKTYRRSAPAPAASTWREWWQRDWRGGDGQRWEKGLARYRAGYGTEIAEGLKLAAACSASFGGVVPVARVVALVPYGGLLFAVSGATGEVYSLGWGDEVWARSVDTGKASLRCGCVHGGKLYVGSGVDGLVKVYDGSTWGDAFTVPGVSAIGALCSYWVWDATAKKTVPRLVVGVEHSAGEAEAFSWDGLALTALQGLKDPRVEAMTVYAGRLHVATSDRSSVNSGRLQLFDGGVASGAWSEAAMLADDYLAGLCAFDGLLFCGSGTQGKVYAFDGERLVEAYDLAAQGVTSTAALSAMAVAFGRLHVGFTHLTDGGSLLERLPSSLLQDEGLRVVAGGGKPELEAVRRGWYMGSSSLVAGAVVRSATVWHGMVYFALEGGSASGVYRRGRLPMRAHGQVELSGFRFDGPVALRRVFLEHDKLPAGYSISVYASLEGSDLWQVVENFVDQAGCDLGRTTADWRPEGAGTAPLQVRLKGMPAQTYLGKVAGRPGVAHVAYEGGAAGEVAPPEFSAEFSTAGYGAVSAPGGAVAVSRAEGIGEYAEQLYVFDLARLAPAGLKPRVVAYGIGAGGVGAAPGVRLAMWNHQAAIWDLVGMNVAASGEDEAARTLTGTLPASELGKYLSADRRVYLLVRSSWAADALQPAEVGVDFVGLEALWATAGEVVSSELAYPVGGNVASATLTLVSSSVPAGCAIALSLSCDNGETWEAAASGVSHGFIAAGERVRWRAVLTGDGTATPVIAGIKSEISPGAWVLVGTSGVTGSTGATLTFEPGTVVSRLALRVNLDAPDNGGLVVLRGVGFEWAPVAPVKRRWQFDVRCEGGLVLLDGTVDPRSGVEISRRLWAARGRRQVRLVDVDGTEWGVWFEELSEGLGDPRRAGGVQTVASCRLVEC